MSKKNDEFHYSDDADGKLMQGLDALIMLTHGTDIQKIKNGKFLTRLQNAMSYLWDAHDILKGKKDAIKK